MEPCVSWIFSIKRGHEVLVFKENIYPLCELFDYHKKVKNNCNEKNWNRSQKIYKYNNIKNFLPCDKNLCLWNPHNDNCNNNNNNNIKIIPANRNFDGFVQINFSEPNVFRYFCSQIFHTTNIATS